jgi:lipopolysaccharide transport system ATP-binding protein
VTPEPPAISARGITKEFNRRFVRGGYTTFKTQLVQWLRPAKYREELERRHLKVLKGISFDIAPGETVGIIGRNGAGKSTLLKLLTGIYKPTQGTIEKHGRVSALLELGAGFHPEFSGRENIYMNGMILGLTKRELRAREKEIIAFSELEEFIDAPVRTYSSGMYMRLAFSIAVNVDPEILIIDEVLAVGDEHFQHKSKAKLDEFKKRNVAIVLVTHDLGTVEQWCDRAIWLDEGLVAADGDPRAVIGAYRRKVNDQESDAYVAQEASRLPMETAAEEASPRAVDAPLKRWGDRKVAITSLRFIDARGVDRRVFTAGEALSIEIGYTASSPTPANVGIAFLAPDGQWLFGTNLRIDGHECPTLTGVGLVTCRINCNALIGRGIRVDVAITADSEKDEPHDYWTEALHVDSVTPLVGRQGLAHMDASWSCNGNPLPLLRPENAA